MQFPPWVLCLWPGLPKLWMQSRLSALAWAVIFAGLLQGMMLTSWVWPGLTPPWVRPIGWLTVGGIWLVSAVISLRNLPFLAEKGRPWGADALFREAQTEYLRGRWFQAQTLLERILQHDAGDIDARFMLASLYRHVRRIGEAREQLRRLERFELSGKWEVEIRQELEHLDRLESDPGENDANCLSAAGPQATPTVSEAA